MEAVAPPTTTSGGKDGDEEDDEGDTPEIKVLSKKEKEKLKKEREKVRIKNDSIFKKAHFNFIGKEKGTGCRKEGR